MRVRALAQTETDDEEEAREPEHDGGQGSSCHVTRERMEPE